MSEMGDPFCGLQVIWSHMTMSGFVYRRKICKEPPWITFDGLDQEILSCSLLYMYIGAAKNDYN